MKKIILAINPWIYDFAAYDLWLKPLGLLHILSVLKNEGVKIEFIDCLDRNHPAIPDSLKNKLKKDIYGTGKYYSEEVTKPKILQWVPRKYKRYGIPLTIFKKLLKSKHYDLILITSSMTYWYPGVVEVSNLVREKFPSTPIILGGTYPTLNYEHAKKSVSCDYIISSDKLIFFYKIVNEILNLKLKFNDRILENTTPLYEVYDELASISIRTSWGCPFRCSYCSIHTIYKNFYQKSPKIIINEIKHFYKKGIRNIAFYDEALFYNPQHIMEIIERILKENIHLNFHTPNGLHARFINKKLASMMKKVGFINPRLSLETIDNKFHRIYDNKINAEEIIKACRYLIEGGYRKGDFSIYLLVGIPGEDLKKIEESIYFVHTQGAKVMLTEFSPIPKTKIWQEYSDQLLNTDEPLLHNNSIFPFYNLKNWKILQNLKNLARNLNKKYSTSKLIHY